MSSNTVFCCTRAAEALDGLGDSPLKYDHYDDSDDPLEWWNNEQIPFAEKTRLLLGKAYFDCHEYHRAAFHLQGCKSNRAKFLKLYADFIGGQDQDSDILLGQLDGPKRSRNGSVEPILTHLDINSNNPLLLYLYGAVMLNQSQPKLAIDALVRSVNLFPYNWSAWTELMHAIHSIQDLNALIPRLPPNTIMTKLFIIYTHQELFQQLNQQLYAYLAHLQQLLPNFQFLKIQTALLLYHGLDYSGAERIFDEIITADPYRLDDMDSYSNILYVLQRRAKLGLLAQMSCQIDKFRPETNCIVANYYSLKGQHQLAIVYYRRALVLNKSYLSAWTLMGHEYVELKNSHAAIESYRTATDLNPKDFRAWYGLGQAYEVLDMHYYSLYYYQRAANLKPYDSRMWQALGSCFYKLQRFCESVNAYKLALSCQDNSDEDVSILLQIAQIYIDNLNNIDKGKLYMDQIVSTSTEGPELIYATLWLAKLAHKSHDFPLAIKLASSIVNGSPSQLDEATSILLDSKSRLL